MPRTAFRDHNEYIASFPEDMQAALKQIRQTVRDTLTDAEEVISYQMAAFRRLGIVLWYAPFRDHHSVFAPDVIESADGKLVGIDAFRERLALFKLSKSGVSVRTNDRLPLGLIADLARYISARNEGRANEKAQSRGRRRTGASV